MLPDPAPTEANVMGHKVDGEQVTSQGVQSFIGSTGAIPALQICLGAGVSRKKCDKQMTFIVCVMARYFFYFLSLQMEFSSLMQYFSRD